LEGRRDSTLWLSADGLLDPFSIGEPERRGVEARAVVDLNLPS
jgi:hypothetical protein